MKHFSDFEDFSEEEIFGKQIKNQKDLFLIKIGTCNYVAQNDDNGQLFIFEDFGPINLSHKVIEKSSIKDYTDVSYWVKEGHDGKFIGTNWGSLPQKIKNRIEE